MPHIDWTQLPKGVREHLRDRVKDRSISEDDLMRLSNWIKTNPEVPAGEWCKDFGTFTLAGQGSLPKTFLLRGQPCKGTQL
jgi:hypothetical protein